MITSLRHSYSYTITYIVVNSPASKSLSPGWWNSSRAEDPATLYSQCAVWLGQGCVQRLEAGHAGEYGVCGSEANGEP
jgi:hypothetical protein